MTNRSPNAVRSLVALRRLARRLRGVGLSAAWLVGVGAAGAAVSMRKAYPRAPQAAPAQGWPPPRPVPKGRLAVAVVLGASGSVITDAFGPYEVFARSPRFFVYTVSASRPTAMLSGGLAVVPDYSLDDVDAGLAPEPDVVVVPAVAAPTARRKRRCASGSVAGPTGEPTCWGCATAAGCWRPRACWMVAGPPRTGRPSGALRAAVLRSTGSAASATSKTAPSPPPPG